MSDLVKRLYSRQSPNWPIMEEAAAELTRLREQCEAIAARVKELEERLQAGDKKLADVVNAYEADMAEDDAEIAEQAARIASLSAENERLRKALESAESYLAFLDSCDEGSDEGPIVLAKVSDALATHVGEEK